MQKSEVYYFSSTGNSLAVARDMAGNGCNGCGICEKVCPVGNITTEGERPIWGNHCMNCFACYHWCPRKTISLGGYDMNIRRYHHPPVSLTDILNQNLPAAIS